MTSDRPPPNGKAPADPRAQREAKLAAALRSNLRRRKAEAKPQGGVTGTSDGGDST